MCFKSAVAAKKYLDACDPFCLGITIATMEERHSENGVRLKILGSMFDLKYIIGLFFYTTNFQKIQSSNIFKPFGSFLH